METGLLGLRVLVSLGVVLALLWWLSRRVAARTGQDLDVQGVRVLTRQTISPRACVVLIEAEGRRFMLGVTEGGISVLNSTALEAVDSASDPNGQKPAFSSALDAAREAGPARGRDAGSQAMPPSRRQLRHDPLPGRHSTTLTGSILAPETWRQAAAALRGRAR